MVYSVFITESFGRKMKKLDIQSRKRVQKIFLQLKENPYVGNMLQYKFFREKRINEKRLYFLVYDDLSIVLIVAIGGKKTQQETINYIIRNLSDYKKYVKELLEN